MRIITRSEHPSIDDRLQHSQAFQDWRFNTKSSSTKHPRSDGWACWRGVFILIGCKFCPIKSSSPAPVWPGVWEVAPELGADTSPSSDPGDGSHAALSLLLTPELVTFSNSDGRTDLVIKMSHQTKVKKLSTRYAHARPLVLMILMRILFMVADKNPIRKAVWLHKKYLWTSIAINCVL